VCDALQPKSTLNRDHVPTKPIKVKDKLPRRHVQVATLEDLTPGQIEAYVTRRTRLDGISPKTANRPSVPSLVRSVSSSADLLGNSAVCRLP
jgi:hypothetical protein